MWYVLVQEEQLGPMSFQDVLELYYKDMITQDTFVWRDGMAEWLPISMVPEYVEILFKGAILNVPATNFNQTDSSIPAQSTPLDTQSQNASSDPQNASSHPKNASSHMVESTRHFAFPEELLQLKPTAQTAQSNQDLLISQQSPSPNLITPIPRQEEIKVNDSALLSVFNQNQADQIKLIEIKPQKSKLPMILGLIALVSVVIVIVVIQLQTPKNLSNEANLSVKNETPNLVTHQAVIVPDAQIPQLKPEIVNQEEPSQVANQQAANQQVANQQVANQQVANNQVIADQSLVIPTIQLDQGIALNPTNPTNPTEVNPQDDSVDLEIAEINVQDPKTPKKNPNNQNTASKVPNQQKTTVPPVATTTKQTLSRGDIDQVVAQNKANVQSCLSQDATLTGTQTVVIKIQKNGTVSSDQASSPKLRNSPAKSCIEGKVKSFKFPAFNGEPMEIPLPLKL
jgi:hypothetical protein